MKKLYFFSCLLVCFRISAQINLSNGLTACYPLNGNAIELISNLTGTLLNVTPIADRFNNSGTAVSFAGSDSSYITLPNSPIIKSSKVTASFWVKFNPPMGRQMLVFTTNGCTSNYEGYQFGVGQDAIGYKFQNATASSGCQQIVLNSNTVPMANTWYHVVFYAGPDSIKVHVNGIREVAMFNPNPLAYDPSKNVYVGTSHDPLNLPFNGIMDELRFYNRELNSAEINFLYNNNVPCLETMTVSIDDYQSALNNLSVYPNPAKEQLMIEINENAAYEISGVQGQKIRIGQLQSDLKNEININDLPNGFYFLKVENEKGNKTVKVLKN